MASFLSRATIRGPSEATGAASTHGPARGGGHGDLVGRHRHGDRLPRHGLQGLGGPRVGVGGRPATLGSTPITLAAAAPGMARGFLPGPVYAIDAAARAPMAAGFDAAARVAYGAKGVGVVGVVGVAVARGASGTTGPTTAEERSTPAMTAGAGAPATAALVTPARADGRRRPAAASCRVLGAGRAWCLRTLLTPLVPGAHGKGCGAGLAVHPARTCGGPARASGRRVVALFLSCRTEEELDQGTQCRDERSYGAGRSPDAVKDGLISIQRVLNPGAPAVASRA